MTNLNSSFTISYFWEAKM